MSWCLTTLTALINLNHIEDNNDYCYVIILKDLYHYYISIFWLRLGAIDPTHPDRVHEVDEGHEGHEGHESHGSHERQEGHEGSESHESLREKWVESVALQKKRDQEGPGDADTDPHGGHGEMGGGESDVH